MRNTNIFNINARNKWNEDFPNSERTHNIPYLFNHITDHSLAYSHLLCIFVYFIYYVYLGPLNYLPILT